MGDDVKSAVLAGGPTDFMTVRHLAVRGSQREIGRALALEAREHFPDASVGVEPALNRARRRWVERSWPEHFRRMEGIADVMGVDLLDDAVNPMDLPAVPFAPGCSVVWCPPGTADDGHARIARNFDFRTDSAFDVVGVPSELVQPPMMSAPYVIETSPTDGGLAAIVLVGCDFSGCFEGINEAGLAVALLADDESTTLRPAMQLQAGVYETQLPRLVLDQCRDVSEAIEVLRCTKQYDNLFSCHYVFADRHGDAFVWERDTHNAEHVVRATNTPLCVTNYLLHRYESIAALPSDDPNRPDAFPFTVGKYERARTLDRAVGGVSQLTAADLAAALDEVAVPVEVPGARTLWQTIFDLEERSMTVRCYLGDTGDAPRYSDWFTVTIGCANLAE
jgi:Acyl-coenzyme A:6-aminopenicillanic acid acyl-transferase